MIFLLSMLQLYPLCVFFSYARSAGLDQACCARSKQHAGKLFKEERFKRTSEEGSVFFAYPENAILN